MDLTSAFVVSSCLLVPTFGIAFSDVLFVGVTGRNLIPVATIFALCYTVFSVQFPRGMPSYLTGVLTTWITLRTFVIFGIYGDPNKYLRLEALPDQSGGAGLIWTSPLSSAKTKLLRLYWALELMTDFRGTRWCYSSQGGRPCAFHKRVEKSTNDAIRKYPPPGLKAAFRTVFRFSTVSTCLWLYNTQLHSALRIIILRMESSWDWVDAPQRQALLLLRTTMMTLSSWCAVDMLHTGCRAIYTFSFMFGLEDAIAETTQTSPWGTLAAIWSFGIRGRWNIATRRRCCRLILT